MASCPKHPLKHKHDLAHKQAGKTYKEHYKQGKIIPYQKGKNIPNYVKEKYLKHVRIRLETNI